MEFSIPTSELLGALTRMKAFTTNKDNNPYMNVLYLSKDKENWLNLAITDLTNECQTRLPIGAALVEVEPFKLALDYFFLYKIVKNISAPDITISKDDSADNLQVRADKSRFTIGIKDREYGFQDLEPEKVFAISGADLKIALMSVVPFCRKDDYEYVLNSVRIKRIGELLSFTGLNGHEAAFKGVALQEVFKEGDFEFLIRANVARQIIDSISGGDLIVSMAGKWMVIDDTATNSVYTYITHQEQYPDCNTFLDKFADGNKVYETVFPYEPLLKIVSTAASFYGKNDPLSNNLALDFEAGKVKFELKTEKNIFYNDELEIDYKGENFGINLGAKEFLSCLNMFPTCKDISIIFTGEESPLMIFDESDEDYRVIEMPLHRSSDVYY